MVTICYSEQVNPRSYKVKFNIKFSIYIDPSINTIYPHLIPLAPFSEILVHPHQESILLQLMKWLKAPLSVHRVLHAELMSTDVSKVGVTLFPSF